MRHGLAFLVACLAISTLGSRWPAYGSPGLPDFSFARFGQDSKTTVYGNLVSHLTQPDGRIVLVGTQGASLLAVRLQANGELDPTFGMSGRAVLTNDSYAVVGRSVALQADGKFVIAGYADTQPADYMLARLTTTGALDGTFGDGGWVRTAIGTDTDMAEKVLIQPDGRIVAAGRSHIGGDWDFSMARYTSSGALDPTFNDDGKASIGFGNDDECVDMALQPDGKLVVVGSTDGAFDEDFAVARLDVAGHLDAGFGIGGKLTTGFGSIESADAVALQPDGRIVVAGYPAIARYTSNGSLDDSFDGDGKKGLDHHIRDLTVRPDGVLVMVGNGPHPTPEWYDFELILMNPDGSAYDATYGDRRFLGTTTDLKDNASVSLLPDGRSIAVLPFGGSCVVMRTFPNLLTDGGYQTVAYDDNVFPAGSIETASSVAVQPDGKIVLAGEVSSSQSAETDFAVVRLRQDGELDPTFGNAGRATVSARTYDTARAMALQSDGKIVVAGYTGNGTARDFMVARFLANGTLDPAFGFFGYNLVNFMGGADLGSALGIAADGKIVVAGTVWNGARYVFGVARLTADGVLDNTFDGDGKQLYEFSVGPSHSASAVVVQPDLKIVVGGHVGADFALLRLNANGSVDGTFGTSGRTLTNLGGNDYLNALTRASDGRLFAAGTRDLSGHSVFALAEYQSNGTLITSPPCQRNQPCSHWPAGTAFVDWGSESGTALTIDVRADGQIAVAGCVGEDMGWCQLSAQNPTPSFTYRGHPQDYGPLCLTAAKFLDPNLIVMAGYLTYADDLTMFAGRFESTINAVVGVDDRIARPAAIRLEAPRPNPFVRASTFAFDLQQGGPVRLALYDVAGRLVRTLVDREETAGHHQQVWDGTDDHGARVAPGVYFTRLTAGAEHSQGSVVVLR